MLNPNEVSNLIKDESDDKPPVTQRELDKRICDVEEGATNTQTYREYIREVEENLGLERKDLYHMSDEELTDYLDWLDYLESK